MQHLIKLQVSQLEDVTLEKEEELKKQKNKIPNFCDLKKIHDFQKWRIIAFFHEQIMRMHKRQVARLVIGALKS
jgi:hypothetical protein